MISQHKHQQRSLFRPTSQYSRQLEGPGTRAGEGTRAVVEIVGG